MSKESNKSNVSVVNSSKTSLNNDPPDEQQKQSQKKLMTVEESETGNVRYIYLFL